MSQLKGATHERAYWISIRKVGMTYWEIGLTVITLVFYCLSNSAIMAGLFMVAQPTMPFSIGFKKVLGKTVVSLGIVFCFYLLLARMFCWTAWLAECLYCLCPTLTTESFMMQNTLPAPILFFFGVTGVQLALIAIPQRLAPLVFVIIVAASNLIASLLKLGFVAVWAA